MMTRKAWFYTKAVVMMAAVLAAVVLPLQLATQTHGVCLKAGRVLSEEELRRAVLLNMVDHVIEQAIFSNRELDSDSHIVGIASPALETNYVDN
jgi:hypothetical protein